nr:GNAT family N-acetyltransferase [Propionibacterium sp.]
MTASNVEVRLCTPADLPLLSAREPGATRAPEYLELAARGNFFFVAAFAPDEVAGYVALDCRPETELAPEMRTLWVYPEYRRRGLGVRLSKAIEEIAAAQGYTEVRLGVDPENPAAIPMYISLDYTPTGDHRTVVEDGVEQREAIYRKSLTIGR